MYTASTLASDLVTWGVAADSTLLVHSSMRSIGAVDGGAETVCETLAAYFEPGLLVLPTHTWRTVNSDGDVFDPEATASCVGILPEVFRHRERVVRSLHPTHSVAAAGRDAATFIADEELRTTPCPRAGVYGRLLDRRAYVVFLGAPMTTNTFVHGVEEWFGISDRLTTVPTRLWVRTADRGRLSTPQNGHWSSLGNVSANYGKLQQPLKALGMLRRARFGDAEVLITTARGVFELASHLLRRQPALFNTPEPVAGELLQGFEVPADAVLVQP